MIGRFPEALSQHPLAFGVRSEILIMSIWLPVAGMALVVTFVILMIYKAFGGRAPLEVAIKASLWVATAVFLLVPLYQLPFFVFRQSSDAVAIAGLCLDGLLLSLGIVGAGRVVKHAQNPAVSP